MSAKIHREGYSRIIIDNDPLEDGHSPFLVDGMISATLTLLYGPPKQGKSTLAAALGIAVANGKPFLGHPVRKSGKVAIIAGDPGDDDEYAEMIYGRVPPGMVSSYAFARPPLPETWVKVQYELSQEGTVLAVIDNLNVFAPGDVNEQRSVRIFFDVLDQFTRAGIAVVLVHHSTEKHGGGYSTNPMGSTAISAASRRKVRLDLSATGPLKLSFEGNYGPAHEMYVSRPEGIADFEVVKVVTADELSERRRQRSKSTLDRNNQIAAYWRTNCQGMTQRQAAEKIAAQFGGTTNTHQAKISRVYSKIAA